MVRILLVEDDPRIVAFVRRGLEAEGFAVDVAENGRDALSQALATDYPLIVLDRVLPEVEGLEICRALRRGGRTSLILVLTAMETLQDKVDGLRGGADDYLTKPFAFDELLVRMEALLRRGPYREAPPVLRVGDLVLDEASCRVVRGEREIQLTAKEYALLRFLMANAGTVVSRARLLSNVWRYSFDPGTKVVDVYVSYLRKKIDEGEERPLIQTVRGFGYRLAAQEGSIASP